MFGGAGSAPESSASKQMDGGSMQTYTCTPFKDKEVAWRVPIPIFHARTADNGFANEIRSLTDEDFKGRVPRRHNSLGCLGVWRVPRKRSRTVSTST